MSLCIRSLLTKEWNYFGTGFQKWIGFYSSIFRNRQETKLSIREERHVFFVWQLPQITGENWSQIAVKLREFLIQDHLRPTARNENRVAI